MMVVGGIMGSVMESGMVEAMKAYAQSAGYAEQALTAIRVVHTYGQEVLELRNYSKFLEVAREAQASQTVKQSVSAAFMFLVIYGFYGYSLWFGGVLRWNEIRRGVETVTIEVEVDGVMEEQTVERDLPYSSGPIVAVMFSVVFGAMMLGMAAPGFTAIFQGKVAGKLVRDCLDYVPVINALKGGK